MILFYFILLFYFSILFIVDFKSIELSWKNIKW